MIQFVQKEFVPMLKGEDSVLDSFPRYMASIKPLVQMSAFFYYIQKDRHVHLTNKIHAVFCDRLKDTAFQEGMHKMIWSILAAVMTQSDQAIRMYPVIMGLGKQQVNLIEGKDAEVLIHFL